MEISTWQKIVEWLKWFLEKLGFALQEAKQSRDEQVEEETERIQEEAKKKDAAVEEQYENEKIKDVTDPDEVLDFWTNFGNDGVRTDDPSNRETDAESDTKSDVVSDGTDPDQAEIKSSQSGG